LFQPWNSLNSPGCAVAVMKDGQIAYERGYGMADLEHEAKITPATVFNVGSIAKQFTATAILMLVQEGKISLDDPIRMYIPELPDFGTPITLREMLHHTSGLRDYEQLLYFDGWRLDSPDLLTDSDVMYIMTRQKELNFPPGSDFAYSNTNYYLLAQVVSRVSKQSFPDFTMTRLFQPLGMKHTHFRDDHGEVIKNVAYSYITKDGGFDLCLPNYDIFGATNLFTTVEDLARWEENFYTAKVGGPQLIRQLQEPGALNDGTFINYAPGMFVSAPGANRWAQSGTAGDAGYRADVFRFPDHHLSAITFCNLGSIDPSELDQRIVEIYLGAKLSVILGREESAQAASFHPDSKQLAEYVGTYADRDENLILKFDLRGDSLWGEWFMGAGDVGPAKFEALSENRFRGLGMKIDFGKDPSHRELTAVPLGMPTVHYRRVPDYKPTTAELREFAGVYSSKELDLPTYLNVEGDKLVLHPPKAPEIGLAPLANDLFVGGTRRVRFTRDSQKNVSGLLMSGLWNRVRNLRFERMPAQPPQ
jgi:CubicO group peptidase (beta-lactamase class C family)